MSLRSQYGPPRLMHSHLLKARRARTLSGHVLSICLPVLGLHGMHAGRRAQNKLG